MELSAALVNSGWHLIANTSEIGALFRSNGFSDRIIVTFDQLSGFNYGREHVSGDRVVIRCEADHMHLSTTKPDWFQSPDLMQTLEAMKAVCSRYREVILYGQSMGGYGALLFSGPLKATNVVAFAPQFSVDQKVVPFENRFTAYVPNISFLFDDMSRSISRSATKHIVYDPFTDLDKRHAELLFSYQNVIPIRLPFAGHLPGQMLREGGYLSDVIVDLLLDLPNSTQRRQWMRSARRKSHRYFLERAVHIGRRGNLKEALKSVNIAYVLDPESIAIVETVSCILMMDASYYGLAHMMVRLILAERPDLAHYKDMQKLIWRELAPTINAVVEKAA